MAIIPDSSTLSLFDGKRCCTCKQWQPLSMFCKSAKRPGGLDVRCKACTKKYREANKSAISERHQRWYLQNRDSQNAKRMAKRERKPRIVHEKTLAQRRAEYNKAYIARKREQIKEQKRKYRQANIEHFKEADRLYRLRNLEQVTATTKEWRKKNADKVRVYENARRAKKMAGGKVTDKEWQDLKAYYGFKCLRCCRTEPEIRLTQDHVIPISKWGPNTIDNIQPLCRSCNSSKKGKTTDYR